MSIKSKQKTQKTTEKSVKTAGAFLEVLFYISHQRNKPRRKRKLFYILGATEAQNLNFEN